MCENVSGEEGRYLTYRNSALAKSTLQKEVHAAVSALLDKVEWDKVEAVRISPSAGAPGNFEKKFDAACRSFSLGARENASQ